MRRVVRGVATGLGLLAGIQSCGQTPAPPAATTAVDSLFEAGLSLYGDENFDSAKTVWTVALERARAGDDNRSEARILTEISLADWRLSNVAAARAGQEQAIDLKSRLAMSDQLSRSYNALGLIALAEARNLDAIRHFDQAIETARAVGDSAGMAKAAGNLALPAGYLGEFSKARAAARQLREAGRALGDARWEGNGLSNEAMVDLYIGDPRPAIARLDTARQLYQRIVYRTGEQVALGQLATAWELIGQYDRSFAALDVALSIARRLGLREDEAINLRLIGELHERIGDYRRAIRFYEQSDTIFRETGAQSESAMVLRGLARSYFHLGNLSRARQSAESALVVHRAAEERPQAIDDLLLLAEVGYRTGGVDQARPYLDSARALGVGYATRGSRIAVALAGARIADLAGESRRVISELKAVAPDVAPGDYGAEWELAALEARAYGRLGQLDAAVAAGRRSVAAIERLRGVLPSDALRGTLVTDRARVYADLVLALLRLRRPGEAFAVADAARSRGLLEHLSMVRGDTGRSALPQQLADGDELLRRIDQLVQRLRETERQAPRERGHALDRADVELTAQLASARNEYEALFVRIARQDPRAGALLGTGRLELAAVRSALRPSQGLVEYLLARDRLIVFVLTTDSLHVVQAALDRPSLTARVQLLRDLWGSSRSDWRLGLAASRALHRTLIEPIIAAGLLEQVTDLFIVPHGILGQLPFGALQNDRTGRFVVQDYTISHLPSATALPSLVGRTPASKVPLAGGIGFAPFPSELPASAPEVAAIATHLAGTESRLGPRASETAVRAALSAGNPVHVATHGVLNTRNPMFSRIELARAGAITPQNDGRLEVHEILGLTIRSTLVFFSGCETGAGQEWSDDPLLGTADLTLAQAVLAAGAGNVISTLWRIDDAGAAAFADHFYRRLRHHTVAEAFALAQRAMAGDGTFGNPYYWAGYTLSGTGRSGGNAQDRQAASVLPTAGANPRLITPPRSRP